MAEENNQGSSPPSADSQPPDAAQSNAAPPTAAAPAIKAPVAFAESLPESIRGEAAFRDIKDLDGLAKSYLHSQKLLGRDPKSLIAIPGADDVEGLNNVYAALGKPDSIDKYQLTAPKLPEGLTVDEKLQSGFLTKAHELGLNNRQVDALYQWWNQENGNVYSQSVEARQQKGREAEQSLRKDWGQAFDQNLALGEAALNHYALTLNLGEDLSNQLKAEGLNNSPAVIKLLSHLGAQLSEDGVLGKGDGGAGEKALSPGEAQQEIAGLKNDKLFQADYLNKKAPGHAAAVKRMERLYQFAYPVS